MWKKIVHWGGKSKQNAWNPNRSQHIFFLIMILLLPLILLLREFKSVGFTFVRSSLNTTHRMASIRNCRTADMSHRDLKLPATAWSEWTSKLTFRLHVSIVFWLPLHKYRFMCFPCDDMCKRVCVQTKLVWSSVASFHLLEYGWRSNESKANCPIYTNSVRIHVTFKQFY